MSITQVNIWKNVKLFIDQIYCNYVLSVLLTLKYRFYILLIHGILRYTRYYKNIHGIITYILILYLSYTIVLFNGWYYIRKVLYMYIYIIAMCTVYCMWCRKRASQFILMAVWPWAKNCLAASHCILLPSQAGRQEPVWPCLEMPGSPLNSHFPVVLTLSYTCVFILLFFLN